MNVNQKGVKGLIKVIDDLVDRGFYIFPAFDDHSPVDLIAMKADGTVIRLQVKYREPMKNVPSRYELPMASVVNGKKIPIDRTLIDGWAVYCKNADKVVYIPVSTCLLNKAMFHINPDMEYGWI